MRVYGLKTCDTVRRAMRELRAAGHAPQLVDIREEPLPEAMRARLLERFGAALVNRRSATWRALSDEDRKADPGALLAAHPALMKRPLIEDETRLTLGWGPEERAIWLGKAG